MLDATQANSILGYMHGGGAPRTITGSKLRLMTAVGSASANGTELATAQGYTSGTGAPSITWGTAAAQSQANSAAVTVTNMPASTLNGVEVWSTDATPLRVELGGITGAPKTIASGDTFSVAIGALTSALA